MVSQGFDALGTEASRAGPVVFEQGHRHPPQPRQVLRAVFRARPTTVLPGKDVQHPVTIILDAPMKGDQQGVVAAFATLEGNVAGVGAG